MTLEEAIELLQSRIHNGMHCPCCGQFAKVYHRSLNCGMATSLVRMYRRFGLEWQHIPTTIPARSREEGKLAFWELIEEKDEQRPDSGRAGCWRVTEKGEAFIHKGLAVPKYVNIYNGECLGFDGPLITINDVKKFDYAELMSS